MKTSFTKYILVNIILLISILPTNTMLLPQETKLIKRTITDSEFKKLKNFVGTYEKGKNYNTIIDGHGTGLIPPTEEQWREMKTKQIMVDKIESTFGTAELPSSIDNSATKWFPPIGNQGRQGSCVSWACAYYTKTFQEAKEHNWDLSGCKWETGSIAHPSPAYQDKIFSPDFVYHQVNNGLDNGSYYADNINFLEQIGCCTWDKMPCDPSDYTTWPGEDAWRQAPWYRSQNGYNYLMLDTDTGIENLKQLLANGNLAVIPVYSTSYYNFTSNDLWLLENYNPESTNHANTVVGYDDNYGPYIESGKSGYGAFKVANSWGVGGWEHVKDGFYYITYECMKQRIRYTYFYQNLENYVPQMTAVFQINHDFRGENLINIGLGDKDSPIIRKSLNNFYFKGGNFPFPNNCIVLDITEFIPHLTESSNEFFIEVTDGGSPATGTIKNFSVEMYDDYSSQIPAKIYVSTETPVSTQQDIAVYAYANKLTNPEMIVINSPSGGEVFDVGSNPTITYTSVKTSGYINIEYSTDQGATWNIIASNVIDNGSYNGWIVPNTPSIDCKIKISDVDGTPSAISKGLFRIGQYEFIPISLTGLTGSPASWGDYDNDGDLDLLLSGNTGSGDFTKIYRNNGNYIFEEQSQIVLTSGYYISTAWGDYDNDGDLDILQTGIDGNGNFSKVYRNNGNNTFEQIPVSFIGLRGGSIAWGDYDNDGDLDVLLTGYDDIRANSKLYKNNGNGKFALQSSIVLTNVGNSAVAWGDYNNDGNLDILLTGSIGSDVISKIYKNNGDNTFKLQSSISLPGISHGSVAWGDYDNDGDLDILLSGQRISGGPISKIYRNDGNNSFSDLSSISLPGVWSNSVTWGDYDNDGDLDILLAGNPILGYPISKVYRNNGNNAFVEQTSISLLGSSGSTVWGDYDNDGDLDILMTGNSKIYRNDNRTPNTPPSAPSNLKTVVKGNYITFSWDKSTDNETPQKGLTYNLVIGTSPGGCDILSPMSDRSTGRRRIVSIGNTGHCNSRTIKGLANGLYYWSVQALDNNFAGSQFAPEQIITIPLPVELTSFKAEIQNSIIKLFWETATEINNYGFEVERSLVNTRPGIESPQWIKIGFAAGNGNSNSPKQYLFIDSFPSSGNLQYRLKQIDVDGNYKYYSKIAEVNYNVTGVNGRKMRVPTEFALEQNYPNPFNPSTKIRYAIPTLSSSTHLVKEEDRGGIQGKLVTLKVYDILGKEVATLVNEYKAPGYYEVEFSAGRLSTGVYIYRITAGEYSSVKKMILTK